MTLVWKDIQLACRDTQISDEAATFEFRLVHLGQADFYDEVIFLSLKKDIYYLPQARILKRVAISLSLI